VGTAEEHSFLMDHYELNSVGWGSPFLLVPQVTSVDKSTRLKLAVAKEKDIYLSGISPLGVPFNSLRGNTKDIEKMELIKKGKPGSLCPKKYVELNYEYTEKGLCTASYRYQRLKLKDLDKLNLPENEKQKEYHKITDKSCVCVGLGTAALQEYQYVLAPIWRIIVKNPPWKKWWATFMAGITLLKEKTVLICLLKSCSCIQIILKKNWKSLKKT